MRAKIPYSQTQTVALSLRGKDKVNGQWQLMTMLHNIFKVHRYGWVA